MHRATCAKCNKSCEVPFRPNGSRPVYCSDCFKRDDDRRPSFDGRDFHKSAERPSFSRPSNTYQPDLKSAELIKEQFRTVNAKLDAILKAMGPSIADEIAEDEAELDAVALPAKKAGKPKKAKKETTKKKATKKKA